MSTAADIARVKRKLNERADRWYRMLALEALNKITYRTPVDTGRARGNWNVSRGSPDWSTTELTDENGAGTVTRGHRILGSANYGETIWIANGLPYIGRLEYERWSKQAPNGMVRLTAAELQPLADRIARRLRSGVGG